MMISKDKLITYSVFVVVASSVIMLQNPLDPYWAGLFGKLQLTEIIFILCVITLLFSGAYKVTNYNIITLAVCSVLIFFMGITSGFNVIIQFYLICLFLLIAMTDFHRIKAHLLIRMITKFNIVVCVVTLIACLITAIFKIDTPFSELRTGFPYLDDVVRANGPFEPTAKLLSFYLLLVLPLHYYALEQPLMGLNRYFKALVYIIFIVTSLMTLGRSGAFTAIAYSACLMVPHAEKNLGSLILPKILFGIFIFFLTIFVVIMTTIHVEMSFAYCSPVEEISSQYYGSYINTTNVCVTAEIYKNTYFILKQVAWDAFLSTNFWLGGGIGYYYEFFQSVRSQNLLSDNFTDLDFYLPQSTPLLLLVERGFVGAVVWLSGWFYTLGVVRVLFGKNYTFHFLIFILCCVSTIVDLDINNFRFTYLLSGLYLVLSHQKISLENRG